MSGHVESTLLAVLPFVDHIFTTRQHLDTSTPSRHVDTLMTCLHGSSSCLVCIHSKDPSTTLLTSSGQAVYLRYFDHHTLHCRDVRSCCQLPDLDFGAYQRQGWCSTVAREEGQSWWSLESHSFLSVSLEHTNSDGGVQPLHGKKA